MFDLIAGVVAWFYSLVPSYGFAIIMLTLTVMVVVTPLTLKGTRSMLQMQLLQPELKRIQSKYGPGERQEMNQELMAFYQENGINPLGGCLPLLVQMPVFLVLFQVVRGMTRRATDLGTQLGWTAWRDQPPPGPFDAETLDSNEHVFDPQYIPTDSALFDDLTTDNEMLFIGVDLSRSASSVLGDGLIDVLPYLALIVVVLFSSLYQQRQIQGRNTGAQVNPQQQAIMKIMPYFLPVFSWAMPAALVVYFVVSNLYRIAQQAYITHSLYAGDESLGAKLASERSKRGDDPVKTEGKGRPTPKRNEAQGRAAGSARAKTSKNRSRPAGGGSKAKSSEKAKSKAGTGGSKSDPTAKTDKSAKSDKSDKSAKSEKDATTKRSSSKGTGAGRTGRAPTRHGGGRTTDPRSPQHRKKKGK